MIINDPVHGFIEIPEGLLSQLVKHPWFVRLNRISQLGPTAYVYPGGCHSRFLHSIGTFHLITEALNTLRRKGCDITPAEVEGAQAAMLLHDIGHGPMSHCLEGRFVPGMSHEQITLELMQQLNLQYQGALDLAISIFTDQYPKHYLHELICSQLDMDRLDYLCRDSFFAGVREGNIGAQRIIKMLNVSGNCLVVDAKGIYTLENYLMSRRLMYWQVYLHKTALAAQEVLTAAFDRAEEIGEWAGNPPLTPPRGRTGASPRGGLEGVQFLSLDDSDVIVRFKQWMGSDDRVLSLLATDYIDRTLFKASELAGPPSDEQLLEQREAAARRFGITIDEARYLVRYRRVSQTLYSTSDDHIAVQLKDGTVRDISEFSELLHTRMVDSATNHHYLFVQRG
ncbi:MAG: HD domain-containing protein [Bacteroidaceae bacterium]|nr:HD domain-containing protein [Bacteroidaceae bacterium]